MFPWFKPDGIGKIEARLHLIHSVNPCAKGGQWLSTNRTKTGDQGMFRMHAMKVAKLSKKAILRRF